MKVRLTCPNCRVTADIQTQPYPSALDRVEYCPSCGTQDMNVVPEEDWLAAERKRRDTVMEERGWMKAGDGMWIRSPEWRQRAPKADGKNLYEEFEHFLKEEESKNA